MTSGGNNFNDITENQLTEFPVVYWVKGKNFVSRHREAASPSAPSL